VEDEHDFRIPELGCDRFQLSWRPAVVLVAKGHEIAAAPASALDEVLTITYANRIAVQLDREGR
jgi:hypothetical protein